MSNEEKIIAEVELNDKESAVERMKAFAEQMNRLAGNTEKAEEKEGDAE